MPVLEAILVAMLILTAILFVTSVQRPLKGSEAGGVDLSRLSAQTLGLIQGHEFKVGANTYDFEAWVNATMRGDLLVTAEVEDYLTKVLPPGARYSLSLANGYDTLRLVPVQDPGLPRNARWSEIPFFPHWNESVDDAPPTTDWAAPGTDLASHPEHLIMGTTAVCIKAPTGETTGPGGVTWKDYWQDPDNDLQVPASAPFGIWTLYETACNDPAPLYARVALRDGTISDHHMYGLRLVVWFGA